MTAQRTQELGHQPLLSSFHCRGHGAVENHDASADRGGSGKGHTLLPLQGPPGGPLYGSELRTELLEYWNMVRWWDTQFHPIFIIEQYQSTKCHEFFQKVTVATVASCSLSVRFGLRWHQLPPRTAAAGAIQLRTGPMRIPEAHRRSVESAGFVNY